LRSGHSTSRLYRAPVTCRQEVQWQAEAGSGRCEVGSAAVKVLVLQRQWAIRVVVVFGSWSCGVDILGLGWAVGSVRIGIVMPDIDWLC
jgi:hypothetical protein